MEVSCSFCASLKKKILLVKPEEENLVGKVGKFQWFGSRTIFKGAVSINVSFY
jgi:hypothetical protein